MGTDRVLSLAVVQRLQRQGKLAAALTMARQLLEQAREQQDEREILLHLEEVAFLHKELGEYDEALAANDEMLARHRQLSAGELTKEIVDDLSRRGVFLGWARRIEAAEAQFQQACELALQLPPEQRSELPVMLISLGWFAHERGDNDAAIQLLLKAWKHAQGPWCNLCTAIHVLLKLADVYEAADRSPTAKRLLDKGVHTFDIDDYLPYAPLSIAQLHERRGSLQFAAGQQRAALVSYQRALRILEHWGGENISRSDDLVQRIRHKILHVNRGFE